MNTGVGANEAEGKTGMVEADDLEKQGYVRARKDGDNWKLHWAELKDRRMYWFSTQRPPDRTVKSSDLRHTIDLEFYRVGPGPDDAKKQWAFSLVPTHDAPHGTPDYHFVISMEDQLNSWKELLVAATVRHATHSLVIFCRLTVCLCFAPAVWISIFGRGVGGWNRTRSRYRPGCRQRDPPRGFPDDQKAGGGLAQLEAALVRA